jgi:nucleoside-diphosphate-sugar epimerase
MTLPERLHTEDELDERLTEPSPADIACARQLEGDVLIVGAGGKMGPSLARRVRRAVVQAGRPVRVIAASRFSSRAGREALEQHGIETRAVDLLDPAGIASLPQCPHVLFLAGRKFGTTDRTDLTWATNTLVPARVAEHLAGSRMVVFSTGNVYPLMPAHGAGASEDDWPAPVGEYAQSCLGRERLVEFISRERGLRALVFRLNYAVDLRYGTLVDIARKVFAGQPIDLTMGYFNAIWQGDANSYAFRSLDLCGSPPDVLNVTGAERISVREMAEWFGEIFDRAPHFVNREGPVALLSDASRCHRLLGPPSVSLEVLQRWVAHWVWSGGPTLNKPTNFEVTDGRF